MLTLPASTTSTTGMPYGLALMGSAWSEGSLVKWGSAIEDLVGARMSSGNSNSSANSSGGGSGGGKTRYGRTKPKWYGYRERNIPVLNL